jgi:transposase
MAALAKGRLRSKLPVLEQALTGLMRDHHRQLLAMQLGHIDFLDEPMDALSAEMTRRMAALSPDDLPTPSAGVPGEGGVAAERDAPATPMTFAPAVSVLDTIPGVNQRGGEIQVTEWGIDMARFGTAERLAAWSGVAPDNDESAGKRRSGQTARGTPRCGPA